MNRKNVVIAAAVIIPLVVIGLIIYAFSGRSTTTDDGRVTSNAPVKLRVDPDTGEQTTDDPSLHTESEDAQTISILGVENLIDKVSLARQKVLYIKDQLRNYSNAKLNDKYATLTIRPQDVTVNGDIMTGTIRLGDTDTTVTFQFKGVEEDTMQLTITDPTGKNGGTFTAPAEQFYESS